MHRIGMIVFDGVTALDVAGPADVFAEAGRVGADYEITLLSRDGRDVRASNGTRIGVDRKLSDRLRFDTLLVAGGDVLVGATDPDLVDGILAGSANARVVASVCTGAFLFAATGLLDGKRATTHWRHAAELARRHPALTVEPDALFIRDGRFATSAGVSAGIDLALALVEADHSPDVARSVARSLVLFMQRPGGQSQFSAPLTGPAPRTPVVRAVVDAVIGAPGENHDLASLSQRANVTARHLNRLFRSELGSTVMAFVREVRVDLAKAHLDEGRAVTETAQLVGFGSSEAMRRAFLATIGVAPSDYRQRFLTTD